MQQRLSVLTLGVDDLSRSRRFYEQGLGFVPDQVQGDVVFYQLIGMVLALYPRHLLAEDAKVPAEGTGFRGITIAHNVGSKTEVDAVLQEAAAAGGQICKPGQEVVWGGYSGYFADPDGHLWEVAWNPIWGLEADGSVRLPPEPDSRG
jgi:catechol 2,3-dioxygenase-like lactoylglutathione lyase family enzyme